MAHEPRNTWHGGDLVGGHPALDVVNTAGGATKARDHERLVDFDATLQWAVVAGLVTPAEARRLRDMGARDPVAAERARASLCAFREDLHAVLMTVTGQDPANVPARARVGEAIRSALNRADLEWAGDAFSWSVQPAASDLDLVLDRAAVSAHQLLTGPDIRRVRTCERCSWMFLDRSRGRGRRWCSMATCGNRAKAHRHYARTRNPSPDRQRH